MAVYDDSLTLRQARAIYFDRNGFGADGGYESAWVDFKLGPVPFPFPNTPQRKRAVGYHDLHHIVTGYETSFAGELEISAWEIASGCKDFAAAWQLNLSGMAGGAIGMPRRTWAAFLRGRATENLYGRALDGVMDRSVGDVKRELGLDGQPPYRPTALDYVRYALAVLAGFSIGLVTFVVFLPLALGAWPVLYLASRRARVLDDRGS